MMKKIFLICALAIAASLSSESAIWAAAIELAELDVLLGEGAKDDPTVREEIDAQLDNEWARTLLRIYDNTTLFEATDRVFPQGARFPADLRLDSDLSPGEIANMPHHFGFPQVSALASDLEADAERSAYERWRQMYSAIERHLPRLLSDDFFKPLYERYGFFAWLAKEEGGFAYSAIMSARDDLPSERPTAELRRALEQFTSGGTGDATEIFNTWARDIFSGDRVFKSVTVSEEGSSLRVRATLSSGFVAKLGSGGYYFSKAIDGAQRFRDMVSELMTMREAIKSAVGGAADLAGGDCPLPDIARNVRALQKFSTVLEGFAGEHVMNGYHDLKASAYGKMLDDVLGDPSLFRAPLPKIRDALREAIGGGMQSYNGRPVLIAVDN